MTLLAFYLRPRGWSSRQPVNYCSICQVAGPLDLSQCCQLEPSGKIVEYVVLCSCYIPKNLERHGRIEHPNGSIGLCCTHYGCEEESCITEAIAIIFMYMLDSVLTRFNIENSRG